MPDRNITFEIKEHLGTIAKYETNWRKELNIISWNGGTPKFDIRDWDEGHVKMSRGITLSVWEMRKMVDLYVSRNNERAVARGRAIEEERNALRAASFKQKDASDVETAPADEPFDPEEASVPMETTSEANPEPSAETTVTADTAPAEEEPF